MSIEHVSELFAIVLALSVATDRLVLMIRTPVKYLNQENPNPARDWGRRTLVQIISLICALVIVGFLSDQKWGLDGSVRIGPEESPVDIPLIILGVLATGGSSLWKNLLGLSKAVRDVRQGIRQEQIRTAAKQS